MATPVAVQIDPDELARAVAIMNAESSGQSTAEALRVLLAALLPTV